MALLANIFVLGSILIAIFWWRARLIALIALSLSLVAFLIAYLVTDIQLGMSQSEPAAARWLIDLSMRMVGLDPEQVREEDFGATVGTFLSVLLASITVWFAVIVPGFAIWKLRRDIRDQRIVDEYKVKKEGVDDLATMYRYYENGDRITVFSGDFDWLVKQSNLQELTIKLAEQDKIRLVSYKKPSQIEQAWTLTADGSGVPTDQQEDLLDRLRPCFRFHRKKFKFTLINYSQRQGAFLALVPRGASGSGVNIAVQSDKSSAASTLFNIVSELCAVACQDLMTWDQATEQEKEGAVT